MLSMLLTQELRVGWDNMNDSNCMVWKYFVRYIEVGWNQPVDNKKSAGVGNGRAIFGLKYCY